MIYIADIESLVDEAGRQSGHYRTVSEMYARVFGGACRIASGCRYQEAQSWLRLPFCARRNGARLVNKLRNLANLRFLFRKAREDIVVFQSQAHATILLGILLFARRQKIFMIYYSSFQSRAQRFLWRFARRRVSGVICPNKRVGDAFGVPYLTVPDYLYFDDNAARQDEVRPEYDFATVGILSTDKGVAEAIRCLGPTGLRYLVAGKPTDEALGDEFRREAAGYPNVTLRLEHLEDTDYDLLIRQSKAALLNYSEAYSAQSSGVVFDFLFRGKPVLGRRCETLAFVERRGVGMVYDDLSAVDLKAASLCLQSKEVRDSIAAFLSWNATASERLRRFVDDVQRLLPEYSVSRIAQKLCSKLSPVKVS